jgi:hypothetical protein
MTPKFVFDRDPENPNLFDLRINLDETTVLVLNRYEAEKFINELVGKYAEFMHCGEPTCETCNVGAAHGDEDEGFDGLSCIDAAFQAGAKAARETDEILNRQKE